VIANAVLLSLLAQEPVIHVRVREVSTPVSVFTHDGQLIDGLTSADFRVFDNDRLQKAHVDVEFEPLSLVVAVECDRAVRRSIPDIRKVPSVIETLLLGVGSDAAILSFNDEVHPMQTFTGSARLLDTAVRGLVSSGSKSDPVNAARAAIEMLASRPARRRRLLLMITQAGDAGSASGFMDVLRAAEHANVRVFALTIQSNGKPESAALDLMHLIPEIEQGKSVTGDDAVSILTQYTGGRQIPFRGLHALESAMTALGAEFHSEYHLRFSPDSDDPGWHRLRVEVARKGAQVRARSGYFRD
jgi:VWFA-related protein